MGSSIDTTQPSETAERDRPQLPFGAPYVFVLLAVEGSDVTVCHRLSREETVIGRDDGADFRLDDDAVSKAHVRVRIDGPVCTLMDLDSRNGTRLNGRKLRPGVLQRLRHLDELQLGDTRLLVLSGRYRQS